MSVSDEEIINWKKLWQLTSGTAYEVPVDIVKEKLFEVTKELQQGILFYKKCSTSSSDLEKFLKKKKQHKLFAFTNKLQQLLDLDTQQLWGILCFYLLNEYRGSAYSLTQYISPENMTKLLDDIWGFYSMERITLLKIVKNLLEFCVNDENPYHEIYEEILRKIKIKNLYKSYIEQLDVLINEIPPQKLLSGEFYNHQIRLISWSERKMREINEIIQILLLCSICETFDIKDIQKLLQLFRLHGFGSQQRYIDYQNNEIHRDLVIKVTYNEIILFIHCLEVLQISVSSNRTLTSEFIKPLDKIVSSLQNNPENGPIFLSWMLLNYQFEDVLNDDNALRKYRQFGLKAVKLDVFNFLKNLIQHPMYQTNSLIGNATRAIVYTCLSRICDLFNADGSISQYPGVYELLSNLLSWSDVAKSFIAQKDSGIHSLYKFALEYFPVNFIYFSNICYALLEAGEFEYVHSQLKQLKIFATYYDDRKFNLRPSPDNDDEFILLHNYIPYNGINIHIPELTTAIMTQNLFNDLSLQKNQHSSIYQQYQKKQQQQIVHFHITYNYFNVLQNEMNLLLHDTFTNSELNELRLKRINSGIRLLSLLIKYTIEKSIDIDDEIVQPIEMCIDIFLKFKNLQEPPIELFSYCLNVLTALLPIFTNEIITRIINLNILPYVNSEILDYKKYANGIAFDSSLIGSYLINIEKKIGKYDFLMAYLHFLREYIKLGRNEPFKIEIPGLLFLLREILPQIHSWRFHNSNDKNKIIIDVMKFICEILDTTTTTNTIIEEQKNIEKITSHKITLRNICLYSLLNFDSGIVLLRFIALGNAFLQTTMENETNWIVEQNYGITLLVRLSMRILMQILKLKTTIYDSNQLLPLESLIYTQPKQRDPLRIIPKITSYMNNIFDRWLPILSCRLLRRIALEFNVSLLACLDMEPDHVRLMFLQRLPDDLENDDLKCAILEFIEACILKQPGLTEAFFKLNIMKKRRIIFDKKQKIENDQNKNKNDNKDTTNDNDNVKTQENEKKFMKISTTENDISDYSILTFMNDFLNNVKNDPTIIENPLHSRIMSIYHALWRNNMQILASDLISKQTFWSSICNPLFYEKNLQSKSRAFSQLFNILSIELFKSCYDNDYFEKNNNLIITIKRFYDKKYFNKWIEHIFNLPKIQYNNNGNNGNDITRNYLYYLTSTIPDEIPDWLVLLQSFKEFIIIALKKHTLKQQTNNLEFPEDNLKYLAIKCLNSLCERIDEQNNLQQQSIILQTIDLRSFIVISELYLHVLLNLKYIFTSTTEDNQNILKKIINLLGNIVPIYDSLQSRARKSLLSIIMKILDLLINDLLADIVLAMNFLQLIIDIIAFELKKLEKFIQNENNKMKPQEEEEGKETEKEKHNYHDDDDENIYCETTLLLCLNLLKNIAIIFQNNFTDNWDIPITSHKIIIRLLYCTSSILQDYSKYKLTNELLNVLIIFAKGHCSNELINSGISDYLWLKLLPPKELLQTSSSSILITTPPILTGLSSYDNDNFDEYNYQIQSQQQKIIKQQQNQKNTWSSNDWWPIYQKGLELITIIFQNSKRKFLNDTLTFIGVHEEYLMDSILLSKQSLEENSISLIKTTLYLLTEVFVYEEEWKIKHTQSLVNLVRCVQILLDHLISLLYRPKILKRFVDKKNVQQQQQQEETTTENSTSTIVNSLIQPMNDLIELIILSIKCLLNFSPPLLQLICEPEFLASKWESLIEIQFGAPKFNITTHPQLTFGTVLSAVTILTKALNLQNYEFHEVPMNIIPHVKHKKTIETIDDNTSSARLQLHSARDRLLMRSSRSPLKSISVTSTTSLPSLSHELLSNLDNDLCLIALEYILTLLASQSLLALKSEILSIREKQLIRREISNELSLFHDFVRKKIIMDLKDHRSIWQRNKHGIVMMMDLENDNDDNDDDDDDDKDNNIGKNKPETSGKTKKLSLTNTNSMRINVVRRLHLEKQQKIHDTSEQNVSMDISQPISPLSITRNAPSARKPISSSTPFISKSSLQSKKNKEIEKRLQDDNDDEMENEEFNYFISDEEPSYSPLSYVQLVEEDYLHFLSNLFHVICLID